MLRLFRFTTPLVSFALLSASLQSQDRLERIPYNNPGLVVDLGVGLWAWPLPMDYDRDGDLDLVVSCPDMPYRGTYFFENPGEGQGARAEGQEGMPVFKPAVRIADRMSNVQISYVGDEPVVTSPGKIYLSFRDSHYDKAIKLPLTAKIDPQYERYRANQWKLVDWEDDGDLDLVIGIGIWDDYGWDDAWDENGKWKNGPLHGFVYLVENLAIKTGERGGVSPPLTLADDQPWPEFLGPRPVFADPVKIQAGDKPVDVYGMPSPNLADFDGDGDLDLVCGEFLDGFTYFENVGDRASPEFALPQTLRLAVTSVPHVGPNIPDARAGGPVKMDLQMITPVAVDWDRDGAIDLISGDEDGRVALIQHSRKVALIANANDSNRNRGVMDFDQVRENRSQNRVRRAWRTAPLLRSPQYFQQEAEEVKFGALVTPVSVDWNGDGLEDLICGNTAGYIGAFRHNLYDGDTSWSAAKLLRAVSFPNDQWHEGVIRHQAGPDGSIQGPCEAKWGYTSPSVADWDHDGDLDIVVNDIWGKITWYRNDPTELLFQGAVRVDWREAPPKPSWTWWNPEPGELATQWRTTPCVLDWNTDGLNDLVMLDHEGYLAFYERSRAEGQGAREVGRELVLLPPQRIFKIEGPCEFDSRQRPVGDKQDGLLRLNANRAGASGRRKLHFVDWNGDGRTDLLVNSVNVNFLRNVRTDDEGYTWFRDEGPMDERILAGHTTSPTTVDWDKNGIPDLLVGAEDGYLYFKKNPRTPAQ